MKILAADLATFRAVVAHNALDAAEIELCKDAYRRDPEGARATYNALAREIPGVLDSRQWVKLSGLRPAPATPFKPEKR